MKAHGPVCTTGNVSLPASGAENEICAAWKITAQLCLCAHPGMFEADALLVPSLSADYVRDLLHARLERMRNRKNLRGVNLFSFIMPRNAPTGPVGNVPVIIILQDSYPVQRSTIEALLDGTVGCTVTCKPIPFGPGTNYAGVTMHPIYSTFLGMSSKLA